MTVGHDDAVRIKVMKLHEEAQLPRYAHAGPFGDLAADLYAVAGVTLDAGATVAVATGVAMEFPATHGASGGGSLGTGDAWSDDAGRCD